MPHQEPSGPDLEGVVADANAVGLEYVVIGGFSVIFNGFIRATKDSDLLVADGGDQIEWIASTPQLGKDLVQFRDEILGQFGKFQTLADEFIRADHSPSSAGTDHRHTPACR